MLTTACTDLERIGENEVMFYYNLLNHKLKMEQSFEIFLLGQYMKDMKPIISAAGYFQINKSLFTTLISTVATYLIICIQFNNS